MNTQVYVLDSQLQLVPPGGIGNLLIGGDGVVRGYLNRPGIDGGAICERSVPPGRQALSHRRFGAFPAGWESGVHGPRGFSSENSRVPNRAGRNRGGPRAAAWRRAGRRCGARGPAGGQDSGGLFCRQSRKLREHGLAARRARSGASELHGPVLLHPVGKTAAHGERKNRSKRAAAHFAPCQHFHGRRRRSARRIRASSREGLGRSAGPRNESAVRTISSIWAAIPWRH